MTAATDPNQDALISLTALLDHFQVQGLHFSRFTIHAWTTKGVSGVKLQTRMIGGMKFTTLAWFDEFNAEIARVRAARRTTDQSQK